MDLSGMAPALDKNLFHRFTKPFFCMGWFPMPVKDHPHVFRRDPVCAASCLWKILLIEMLQAISSIHSQA